MRNDNFFPLCMQASWPPRHLTSFVKQDNPSLSKPPIRRKGSQQGQGIRHTPSSSAAAIHRARPIQVRGGCLEQWPATPSWSTHPLLLLVSACPCWSGTICTGNLAIQQMSCNCWTPWVVPSWINAPGCSLSSTARG